MSLDTPSWDMKTVRDRIVIQVLLMHWVAQLTSSTARHCRNIGEVLIMWQIKNNIMHDRIRQYYVRQRQ